MNPFIAPASPAQSPGPVGMMLKDPTRSYSSIYLHHAGERPQEKPTRRHLDLGLPATRAVRKQFLLLPPPACGTFHGRPRTLGLQSHTDPPGARVSAPLTPLVCPRPRGFLGQGARRGNTWNTCSKSWLTCHVQASGRTGKTRKDGFRAPCSTARHPGQASELARGDTRSHVPAQRG